MHGIMRFTFATVMLAAAMVMLNVLLTGCGSDEPTDAADPITTTTIDPDRAPTEVRWEPYQGVTLPIGADGPRQTSGGAATGFTQSPQGAALAAINHSVRIGVAPDSQWSTILANSAAPGPARDLFAVNRIQVSISEPVVAAEAPRVLGYCVTDYSTDRAQVAVYTGFPDGSTARNDVTVIWTGGDWRLLLPDAEADAVVASVSTVPSTHYVALEAP